MKIFIISILLSIGTVIAAQGEEVLTGIHIFEDAKNQCQEFIFKSPPHTNAEYKQAIKTCTIAADGGDIMAQYQLGLMYYKGQGVSIDLVLAYMWFNLASNQGYSRAQAILDHLATMMTPCQITEALYLSQRCDL